MIARFPSAGAPLARDKIVELDALAGRIAHNPVSSCELPQGQTNRAGTTWRREARNRHPSRSIATTRQAKSSRGDPCVKWEPTLRPVWQRPLRGANKKILWSASAMHRWHAGRFSVLPTETCILFAGYEETRTFPAHLVRRLCADVSTGGIARSRPPGPGRAGLEGWHRQDAIGPRRQRRLGAGLSLRLRLARPGNDLPGQSTRRSHGAGRGLLLVDAAHQDAHRRHAFFS